ncbi:uncharacterized protein BDZ99DRAFT_475199 [Mytilinidion resinicola]|uniref:BTB domain-containing protein n=1 Tax=Mytilinidion resinicola TaxID=574789 RepID=A0A6A6YUG5_9PEZI|nr:uncharacterized protein BDZ99DRAFT_475199 [Mytilinidion resinicola]KAF2811674.1 hypothetical protein BDZ99DRAFT_475199 [Mytilinidion resinicola]
MGPKRQTPPKKKKFTDCIGRNAFIVKYTHNGDRNEFRLNREELQTQSPFFKLLENATSIGEVEGTINDLETANKDAKKNTKDFKLLTVVQNWLDPAKQQVSVTAKDEQVEFSEIFRRSLHVYKFAHHYDMRSFQNAVADYLMKTYPANATNSIGLEELVENEGIRPVYPQLWELLEEYYLAGCDLNPLDQKALNKVDGDVLARITRITRLLL